VHRRGAGPRLQDAVLEHRRGGTGADGRARHRGGDDLPGQLPAQRPADFGHVRRRRHRGRVLGLYPRRVQGQVEHQRDPVHPDDELCGHQHRGLPDQSLARREIQHGQHQRRHPGGLVPQNPGLPLYAEHPHRAGAGRGHVSVPALHQARL